MKRVTFAEAALQPAIRMAASQLSIETGRHPLWIERRLKEEMEAFLCGDATTGPLVLHGLAAVRVICEEQNLPYSEVSEH